MGDPWGIAPASTAAISPVRKSSKAWPWLLWLTRACQGSGCKGHIQLGVKGQAWSLRVTFIKDLKQGSFVFYFHSLHHYHSQFKCQALVKAGLGEEASPMFRMASYLIGLGFPCCYRFYRHQAQAALPWALGPSLDPHSLPRASCSKEVMSTSFQTSLSSVNLSPNPKSCVVCLLCHRYLLQHPLVEGSYYGWFSGIRFTHDSE